MDTRYVPPHKKGRYHHYNRRQPTSVLPSKFLLGGNINDPLNLNSLGQSDNANTPKTSPMPIPQHRIGEIPIFIPKNPTDPLGLQSSPFSPATAAGNSGTEASKVAVINNSAKSRRHRRRSLRARNDSECSVGTGEETGDKGTEIQETETEQANAATATQGTMGDPDPDVCDVTEKYDSEATGTGASNEGGIGTNEVNVKICIQSDEPTMEDTIRKQGEEAEPVVCENSKEAPDPPESCASGGEVESPAYMRLSAPTSEYVPLSSSHQPSPFVLHGEGLDDNYEMVTFPFESPSLSRLFSSQQMRNEPFSPPTGDIYFTGRRFPAGHYDYSIQQSLGFQPHHPAARKSKFLNVFQKQQPQQRSFYRRRIRHNRLDPIVSPVIPQPGMKRLRHHHHHNQQNLNQNATVASKIDAGRQESKTSETNVAACSTSENKEQQGDGETGAKGAQQVQKSFHPKNEKFQYGNYNRYYGYRNSRTDGDDVRVRMLRKEWLEGKDVLDIGCNVGHVTLSVARDFKPRRVVGVDIDESLIIAARKNIKHYVDQDPCDVSVRFPQYLPLMYGALKPCPQPSSSPSTSTVPFPYNVTFRQENYVLEADIQLESVQPEYDAILCLSVTKWVHLNFGDSGMQRFFKRVFRHLRPGGVFILEPQNWNSYKKKKKLTEKIFATFKEIRFFPDQFEEYLTKEIGFLHAEVLTPAPLHQAKGFQRPLLVFTKPVPALLPAFDVVSS